MEIYKTSFKGCPVSVIFVGRFYLFHNSYYGYLAIAERSENRQESGHELFTITHGNHHTTGGHLGGRVVLSCVKRFINKTEKEHGAKVVSFEDYEKDLANAWLDLGAAFKCA